MRVGNHDIEGSNLDKVFFPKSGVTKGDLVDYYLRVADTMLPYMHDRPVMMHRFPDGIQGKDFYQKDVPGNFPQWIPRVKVRKEGGSLLQLVCNDAATLVYLADQATITPHVWLSRTDKLDKPDRLIFDLDPPDEGDGFGLVLEAARALVTLCAEIDVTPFAMTTGSRGLHVTIGLDRSADFDASRALAREIAEEIERRDPDRFTTQPRKEARKGRLYLDIARNAYAQTAVAPYAVRARPGAPIAAPLRMEELDEPGLGPRRYDIRNLFRRLGQTDDPWRGMDRHVVSVEAVRNRLHEKSAS
jgi:bifunctional non-homologous end joining protein LigD